MSEMITNFSGGGFRLRSYGRTELAQMYCPDLSAGAAWRKLRQWIELSPGLTDRLRSVGCTPRQRAWPPVAVRMIVEALGEP